MVTAQLSACRCGGTGLILDDGTVTDMLGWPLPCPCTDSVPRSVRALMSAISNHVSPASQILPYPHQARSALHG